MAESEGELKSLLMKVKEESEESWLKTKYSKDEDHGICSHLFKNFPQSVVIHIVKDFTVISGEVDVFLHFPCFFYDQTDAGVCSLVRLSFLNPACTSGSSCFTYC